MSKKKTRDIDLNKERLLSFLQTMLLIRYCEEQIVKSYAQGEIPGGVHIYIGEEAVATGVCSNLKKGDVVFSTHRGHGHALATGMIPQRMIAEVMGRKTGCCGGRGGSMHLFDPSVGFYGTSGIVGPNILLATGAAYAAKLAKLDSVSVAFFGDGGTNNGAFHEGINMASAWQLPVIFICENNLYATEVPISYASASRSIAARASAYNIPGVEVDGNDVVSVYLAAKEAFDRARSDKGPTLIECKTYRVRPHAEGMVNTGYRTQSEIDSWKSKDPITQFRDRLLEHNVLDQEEIKAIETHAMNDAISAAEFARKSPMPEPDTLTNFLFS